MSAAPADGRVTGFGTKGYRSYVLTALLIIYILNFVDRGLLSVVAPQMKPELGISDTAFGLLTGSASPCSIRWSASRSPSSPRPATGSGS